MFFGAAELFREREHFRVCVLPDNLEGRRKRILDIATEGICILFFLLLFVYSTELTIRATDETPIFKLSKRFLYGCMPVSSLIMLIYSIAGFIQALFGGPSSREGCLDETV